MQQFVDNYNKHLKYNFKWLNIIKLKWTSCWDFKIHEETMSYLSKRLMKRTETHQDDDFHCTNKHVW